MNMSTTRAMPEVPDARSGKRILLVDDNEDATDLLKMLLELDAHRIRIVCNGRTAPEIACEFLPEVACLDISLPDMSGYQVARALRQIPALAGMTLIAITGMGQDRDRQAGADAGFDHFMIKPLSLDELTGIIRALDG
jgi:DNA-binding response OmpR family regulator